MSNISSEESGEEETSERISGELDLESDSDEIDEDILELVKEDREFRDGSFLIPSEAEKLGIFSNSDNMVNL